MAVLGTKAHNMHKQQAYRQEQMVTGNAGEGRRRVGKGKVAL